jgi:hypothetical protein
MVRIYFIVLIPKEIDRKKKRKKIFYLEFLFHSTTDPFSLNFQQMKKINNGKYLMYT